MFPFDWYWIVGADGSRVYASAREIYVPINDSSYVAWKKAFQTSHISTETELFAILSMYGIGHP